MQTVEKENEIQINIVPQNVYKSKVKELHFGVDFYTGETKAPLDTFFGYYNKEEKNFYFCNNTGYEYVLDAFTLRRYLSKDITTLDALVTHKDFKNLIQKQNDPFPGFGFLFVGTVLG